MHICKKDDNVVFKFHAMEKDFLELLQTRLTASNREFEVAELPVEEGSRMFGDVNYEITMRLNQFTSVSDILYSALQDCPQQGPLEQLTRNLTRQTAHRFFYSFLHEMTDEERETARNLATELDNNRRLPRAGYLQGFIGFPPQSISRSDLQRLKDIGCHHENELNEYFNPSLGIGLK